MTTPESTQACGLDLAEPCGDRTAYMVYPEAELRRRAASAARSLAGLGANPRDPERRERYLDLVAPGETHAARADMARASGCALAAAGFWRAIGVKHRLLDAPYRVGSAIRRLSTIGGIAQAIRWPRGDLLEDRAQALGAMPAAGDIVLVGEEPAREHVFVVVEAGLRAGAPTLWCVDGGQRDEAGYQLVGLREHVWFRGARGAAFDVARDITPGKGWGSSRPVQWWLDLEAVVAATSSAKENV